MPDSVAVARQPLELKSLVRIQVGQPSANAIGPIILLAPPDLAKSLTCEFPITFDNQLPSDSLVLFFSIDLYSKAMLGRYYYEF